MYNDQCYRIYVDSSMHWKHRGWPERNSCLTNQMPSTTWVVFHLIQRRHRLLGIRSQAARWKRIFNERTRPPLIEKRIVTFLCTYTQLKKFHLILASCLITQSDGMHVCSLKCFFFTCMYCKKTTTRILY